MTRFIVTDPMGNNIMPNIGFLTEENAFDIAQMLTRMTNIQFTIVRIEPGRKTTVIGATPTMGNG